MSFHKHFIWVLSFHAIVEQFQSELDLAQYTFNY